MPIFDTLRKLVCCAAREQYEPEAPARRPAPEHGATETGDPGRPYQDYVEDEARKYWQEMVKTGGLKKPDQREIRTAAMPVLGRALRRRQGKIPDPALAFDRAHQSRQCLATAYRRERLDKASIYSIRGESRLCRSLDATGGRRRLAVPGNPVAGASGAPSPPHPLHDRPGQ